MIDLEVTSCVTLAPVLIRSLSLLWAALLLCACGSRNAPQASPDASPNAQVGDSGTPVSAADADQQLGQPIDFKPAPARSLESFGYPRASDGTYVVSKVGDLELRIDPLRPSNPMTVRELCSDWLMQCFEKPGHAMDDCFRSVRRCQTARPWDEAEVCCPDACYDEYALARGTGVSESEAWLGVFARARGGYCVPEYERWLKGGWK